VSGLIHPTALIDPEARLAQDVEVGPYAIIGPGVEIGARTRIGPYSRIVGPTLIGEDNEIFSHCSIGEAPQDKKYAGQPTRLVIGHRNTIREFCTLNRGTAEDREETTIGDDNWIMAYVHIAHDCVVGNHTIFANNATLAGHVHIGDWVILGGFVGVHQFVKVGAHAFIGISGVITQDIPPYTMVAGQPAAPHGINSEGLKRRGFSVEAIGRIKNAYRTLYRSGLSLDEARAAIATEAMNAPELTLLADFLANSTRGILR
jgi:UDP-N-acetylglucosamine acyltransferase